MMLHHLHGLLLVVLGSAALVACGNDDKEDGAGTTGTGGASGASTLPAGTGYCQDTCTLDCAEDTECNMAQGERCCDLGGVKTCLPAEACPVLCTSDSQCDEARGLSCVAVSSASSQRICATGSVGLQTCEGGAACPSEFECCSNTTVPTCVPTGTCMTPCATSAECDTAAGEACCTTVAGASAGMSVAGLCLDSLVPCPAVCTSDAECDTASGEACCGGVCSTACPKLCTDSNQCPSQLCCKSAVIGIPGLGAIIAAGLAAANQPTCTGTPTVACADCYGPSATCSCAGIAGCTETAGVEKCLGTATPCSSFDGDEAGCNSQDGCWVEAYSFCYGSARKCTGSAEAYCGVQDGCYWGEGDASCSGTPTPCAQLSVEDCSDTPGCSLETP